MGTLYYVFGYYLIQFNSGSFHFLIYNNLVEDTKEKTYPEAGNCLISGSTKEVHMRQITFEIPGDALVGLNLPLDEAGATVRMAAAMKLYELGRLSSGAAARLAGIPRIVFLSRLADYGVDTFRLSEDELARETRLA
jgi:hypothetical protein